MTCSCASDADGVTQTTQPTFEVAVNKAGLIELDTDGDDAADETRLVAGAGTYSFTGPVYAEGAPRRRFRICMI